MKKSVQDRIAKGLSKFRPVLESARNRDVSESDTVLIIHDMLAELFGWDKYAEVTSEYQIRGTFCDLAVKYEGQVRYLIEVKAINIDLKDPHVRQALQYASENGTDWIVLTNGAVWQVRQVKFEKPVTSEVIFTFDLLDKSTPKAELIEKIYTLCREAVRSEAIEAFAARRLVFNKHVLAGLILSDEVVTVMRRQLRRMNSDVKVGSDEVRNLIESDVLKRELVESDEAKSARRRIGRSAKPKARPKTQQVDGQDANDVDEVDELDEHAELDAEPEAVSELPGADEPEGDE